jgi:hypothetical protein
MCLCLDARGNGSGLNRYHIVSLQFKRIIVPIVKSIDLFTIYDIMPDISNIMNKESDAIEPKPMVGNK